MLGDPLNKCQSESRPPQGRLREACGVGAEGPASLGRALLCSVKANPEGGPLRARVTPSEETPTAQTQTGTATATPAPSARRRR